MKAGARYLGFIFYPPSPRAVTPEQAIDLGKAIPPDCIKVGVMVDPEDGFLQSIMAGSALDAVQLHGKETPARVRAVKALTGKMVIKAMRVGDAGDLAPLAAYADAADMLLFDTKPPSTPGSLPGGNGLCFDWRLLQGLTIDRPWLLSGGLDVDNVEEAVRLCQVSAVDVSSGVEASPGVKDVGKIRDFLNRVAAL